MAQQWHVAYTTELHKAKRNRRKRDGVLYVFGSRLELHHVNEDGSREGEPVVRSLATERIEEGAIISLEECEIEIAERIDCGRDFPLQSSNAQRLPNNRLQQPRQREQQPLRDNTNKDFMDDIWAELEGGKGGASEPGARHKPTSYSYQQRTKGVIWPSNTLQRSEWCGPSLCGAFSDEAVNGEQGRRVEIKAQFRDGKEYLEVLEQAIIEETRLKMVHGVKEIRESLSQLGEQHQLPASTFGSRLSLYSRSYLERRGSKLWLQVEKRLRENESRKFGKGDFWAVSPEANFPDHAVVVLQSCAHGFAGDHLEVSLVTSTSGTERDCINRSCYALFLGSFATELLIWDIISKHKADGNREHELVDYLARVPCQSQDPSHTDQLQISIDHLNPSQRRIFTRLSDFPASHQDVGLLHGPFGSGKTMLLAELISYWERMRQSDERILVVSHTNVAVDRLLVCLKEKLGFSNFVRVGSWERIDPRVQERSLQALSEGFLKEDIKEVDEQLSEGVTQRKRKKLEYDKKQMKQEVHEQKVHILESAYVVAVTISSTGNEVLANSGLQFSVCVCDEATQLVEPALVAPLLQHRCGKLLAVGDPKQLPPVVARDGKEMSGHAMSDLSRPLFTRLKHAGHDVHFLDIQCRCHPEIATVASDNFYEGALTSAVSESEREALMPGLAPIMFVATGGKQAFDSLKSSFNRKEADAVTKLVHELLPTVNGADIGVIAFYSAQVKDIGRMLTDTDVKVSTVDSFQGTEKEVIILSLCNRKTFITGERCNVAVTRARRHLICVGREEDAVPVACLRSLLSRAKQLGAFLDGHSDFSILGGRRPPSWGTVAALRH